MCPESTTITFPPTTEPTAPTSGQDSSVIKDLKTKIALLRAQLAALDGAETKSSPCRRSTPRGGRVDAAGRSRRGALSSGAPRSNVIEKVNVLDKRSLKK